MEFKIRKLNKVKPGGGSLDIKRREDPKTLELAVTITLTRDELLKASGEVTPAERQSIYLMSQSPLLSTQLCSLLEIVSALEKAAARDSMEKLESTEDLEDPEGSDE